jgi:alpha-mannosidase
VKCAEEGDALIVRLVEAGGEPDEAVMVPPSAVTSADRTNLLERQGEPLPWEFATLRLERGP